MNLSLKLALACALAIVGCSNAVPLDSADYDPSPEPIEDVQDGEPDPAPDPLPDVQPDPEPSPEDVPDPEPEVEDVPEPDPMPDIEDVPEPDPNPDPMPDIIDEPDPEPDVPEPLRYTAVVSGKQFSCGLVSDGSVNCWGALNGPQGIAFDQLTAGDDHACGLKTDGFVFCWGDLGEGRVDIPDVRFSTIDSGSKHICGLTEALPHRVLCWGKNMENESTPPTQDPDDGTMTIALSKVGAGDKFSCGLLPSGELICWGSNGGGMENEGRTEHPIGVYERISVGHKQSCAVERGGDALACWGKDEHDFLSDAPATVAGDFDIGNSFACAINDQFRVLCWGNDMHGKAAPYDVIPEDTYVHIGAGREHACALTDGGQIHCWGGERDGAEGERDVTPLGMPEE